MRSAAGKAASTFMVKICGTKKGKRKEEKKKGWFWRMGVEKERWLWPEMGGVDMRSKKVMVR